LSQYVNADALFMNTLHKVIIIGSILTAATTARAQQHASEASDANTTQQLAENIGPDRLEAVTRLSEASRNSSILLQRGDGNTAHIDQQSLVVLGNQAYIAQVGTANTLEVLQAGGANIATVEQRGNGNQANLTQQGQNNTSLLTQRGDNNRLTGTVAADRTELNINQNGSNNQVSSEIRESQRSYTINQYGNNNSLKQVESTIQATPGYTVEMRGSGINLTIEQGKIKP
jgi:minor curlin subunit